MFYLYYIYAYIYVYIYITDYHACVDRMPVCVASMAGFLSTLCNPVTLGKVSTKSKRTRDITDGLVELER